MNKQLNKILEDILLAGETAHEIHGIDGDLESAFDYNSQDNISPKDIEGILAEVPGEADGFSWHWLAVLKDGRFCYLIGGCDYTGWDYQSSLQNYISSSLDEVLDQVDSSDNEKKPIRQQIEDQLHGKQPFGLREE